MGRTPSIDVAGLGDGRGHPRRQLQSGTADFIRRSVHGATLRIDLGAHVGVHTTLLAELVRPAGSVIADRAEPSPCRAPRRSRSAAGAGGPGHDSDSGGGRRRWRHRCSFGAGAGVTACLASPPGRATGALEVVEHVRVVGVDDVPRRGRVSFMKIDVEGAESLALAGASRCSHRIARSLVDLHPHLACPSSAVNPRPLDRLDWASRLPVPSARRRRAVHRDRRHAVDRHARRLPAGCPRFQDSTESRPVTPAR